MLSAKIMQLFKSQFSDYTAIQKSAIPMVKSGKDTLIVAPTGSGKTEAALLPLLDSMHSNAQNIPITMLYITPLRALNRDMVGRLRRWCRRLNFKTAIRHGDTSQKERSFQSRHPPHILITTPETLQILIGTESFRSHLKNLRYVVVDELHELIGSKRGAQLSLALTRLRSISHFQTIALSATIKDAEGASHFVFEDGYAIAADNTSKQLKIDVLEAEGKSETARLSRMCSIIKQNLEHSKMLVFANTRYMAELIGSKLIADGLPVAVHHGSLSKEERESVEDAFKGNKLKALVCTSSLELGIDVGDADAVVQINSPKQVRKALQRIGRSGHAHNKRSRGIIIAHNAFDLHESAVIAARCTKNNLEADRIIHPSLDVLAHAVCGELLFMEKASDAELHKLMSRNRLYSAINFDEFRLLLSEMHRCGVIFYDGAVAKKTYSTRKHYFSRVSTIPSSIKYSMMFNGRVIGYLDDRFVCTLKDGDVFITRGTPWVVLSIEEDRVIVGRAPHYVLAIPEWEGEQLSVGREIAESVGEEMAGCRDSAVLFGDMLILFSFLGDRANSALALALANRLTNYFSAEVSAKSSPYAVFLKLPYPLSEKTFVKLACGISVKNEILSSINKNPAFARLFSQVAKYMGLSERHEHYSPYYLSKLSSTAAYKESLAYFMWKYCDTDAAQLFVDRLAKGKQVRFSVCSVLPSLAQQVLDHMSGSQVIFPDIPESAALFLLENQPAKYRFICANCGRDFYTASAPLPEKCIKCSSVLLAPADGKMDKKPSKSALMRRAALYNSYGKRALIALSTYGVGVETAMRILARLHKSDRSLALDLLRAREQFIRTKKYWSPS